ncbi:MULTISPECIES: molybdopterin cofactor-binding domain-containing protein [unclassified Flavobacterium]|uniref:xanthine dehydrogenase family protein molybdopterin-binding subunit n=1 Tax=unclassified Flavobacterium TaxID=196869 RepID=UPI000C18E2AC|nr:MULTISPECIES: molybdopterin cofactor-binding domain-containing protein [unclassified Flavobacterium]PIF63259.1 isoquinoline 1-oxidoreductase beta subunit [Flavobacterium sp. 11]WKL44497.1 molybdopterin-dependent oxidoreductase [Flavobacterium sp. ZE23DGlu08]
MVSRRQFIKNTGKASFALWLGATSNGFANAAFITDAPSNFTPFVKIEKNGKITIFNTKPEMGQGTFQSVPALIAEELEVSLDAITIVQTSGEKQFGGGQAAGGSSSIRGNYDAYRKIGAAAKEMLVKAASVKWGIGIESCYAENGSVHSKLSKEHLSYGDLIEEASKLEVPKEPKLKNKSDFKIIGKSIQRPDVPLKVSGKAEYGIDVEVPNMVYATVFRSPVIGGTLKSFDADATLKIPGVIKVVEAKTTVGKYQYSGVAVIAKSYWAALQGRKVLKVEWDTNGYENFNLSDYENKLRNLSKEAGVLDKNIGNVESVKTEPGNSVESFYETPMVAHHTLEPMNCIAHVNGEMLTIWTSTQVPSAITGSGPNDLHSQIGMKPENITLHSKFIGGGFGRRLYTDYVIEAVNIAKQIEQPVKVIWSREDTTQHSAVRPMTFSQLKGGFSKEGELISFQHKVISPSYFDSVGPNFDKTKVDAIMIEGIGEQAYQIPNIKTSYVYADFHVPVAAWRSVTSSTVAFAHECFIDELAHKVKKDPLDFRLQMLDKDSDTKRVLLKLKEVSNWDKPLPKGKGRGVAQWEFFAGLCAHVVEVSVTKDNTIKIDKVYAVIDLGEVVNPDNVKNQIEGSIVMALTAAIKTGITIENGKIKQSNFHDNPMIRMHETPEIEVHILADGGKIKGVGEPGLPPFAPALANAIFSISGKRIKKMPFDLKLS